jgi:hypothetical protein
MKFSASTAKKLNYAMIGFFIIGLLVAVTLGFVLDADRIGVAVLFGIGIASPGFIIAILLSTVDTSENYCDLSIEGYCRS